MKITTDNLNKLHACTEGVSNFEELFPNGIDVPEWTPWCQTILLGTKMRRWIGWAWRHNIIPIWSLSYANLSYADLRNANLYNANLSYANLSYANLYNANLYNADLYNADLSYANLSYANLSYANLRNANLRNANLYNANLRNAYLHNAKRNHSDPPIQDWKLKNGILVKE
jgi:uncharacterized protein YjbI with pentapeptide repeats